MGQRRGRLFSVKAETNLIDPARIEARQRP
jgi:hypothetical protein